MLSLVERCQLGSKIAIESAGTLDYHAGEPPDRRARAAAKARGVELTRRARQFAPEDWQRFDYVVAMDQGNLDVLAAGAPDAKAREKLRLLRSFDPDSPPGAAVPDPFYGGPEGFEEVLDLCESACAGLLAVIRREHEL